MKPQARAVFVSNTAFIERQNAAITRGAGPHVRLKMNGFGDLTHAEFAQRHLTQRWSERAAMTKTTHAAKRVAKEEGAGPAGQALPQA